KPGCIRILALHWLVLNNCIPRWCVHLPGDGMENNETADKAKAAVAKGADKAEQVIEKTAANAGEATRRVEAAATRVIDESQEVYMNGRDSVENALACASRAIQERPLTSMALVALVAYFWGRMR